VTPGARPQPADERQASESARLPIPGRRAGAFGDSCGPSLQRHRCDGLDLRTVRRRSLLRPPSPPGTPPPGARARAARSRRAAGSSRVRRPWTWTPSPPERDRCGRAVLPGPEHRRRLRPREPAVQHRDGHGRRRPDRRRAARGEGGGGLLHPRDGERSWSTSRDRGPRASRASRRSFRPRPR